MPRAFKIWLPKSIFDIPIRFEGFDLEPLNVYVLRYEYVFSVYVKCFMLFVSILWVFSFVFSLFFHCHTIC